MAALPDGRADAAGRGRARGRRWSRPCCGGAAGLRRAWCCWSARATTAATRCGPAPGWPPGEPGWTRVLTDERVHAAGLAALTAAGGTAARVRDGRGARRSSGEADVVVDGLLGIGGRAGLRGAAAALAELPARCRATSRSSPSTCPAASTRTPARRPGAHVRATHTVTFGVLKPCLLLPPARHAAGEVALVDIGLEPHLDGPGGELRTGTSIAGGALGRAGAGRRQVPPRGRRRGRRRARLHRGGRARRGRRGRRGGRHGAVRRAGRAVAAWCGRAGRRSCPATDGCRPGCSGRASTPTPTPASARPCGGRSPADLPCVVDAGALALLPSRREAPTLLTPHAGELARLLSDRGDAVERADVEAAPLRHARRAAELTGATVLLKGATAVICAPTGIARTQDDGPHWLATAGSGDVLAGLLGTLLAAGLPAARRRRGRRRRPRPGRHDRQHGRAARGRPGVGAGRPDQRRFRAGRAAGSRRRPARRTGAGGAGGDVRDGGAGRPRLAGRPAGVGARGRRLREWHA